MDPQLLPDSLESSPRSRAADLDELPQVPNAKLRLMCSYGGQISPRPHDKVLLYIGGETRLVVVDRRQFSLSSFCTRLSTTLVNGRPFTLKYQLPHEDLDSLISIATDEDLENMIEEYERASPARIRVFIFFAKPEKKTACMGSLLDDAKSKTWFVDALNQSGLLQRNLSDSATMNCLVPQELQPLMPEDSLNGSSASTSPSIANLPPIRVCGVDQDQKVLGIEEQFGRLTLAQVVQKHDDCFGMAPPPLSTMTVSVADPASVPPGIGGYYYAGTNRVLSDDERSDQGIPVAFRKKPTLPLHSGHITHGAARYNFPSPDSVASDCSKASSANSLSNTDYTKDFGGYALPQQSDQQLLPKRQPPPLQHQQIAQTSMHYVPHQANIQISMSSCHPTYVPPGPLPSVPSQLRAMDEQYLQYVMPLPQTKPYNVALQQPSLGDVTTLVTPIRPPMLLNSTVVSTPVMYKASGLLCPLKAVTPTPQVVQVSAANQHYTGFSHPPQPIAIPPPPIAAANYGYEYSTNHLAHDQVYYGPHQAVALSPHYRNIPPPPPPPAVLALANAAKKLPSADHRGMQTVVRDEE